MGTVFLESEVHYKSMQLKVVLELRYLSRRIFVDLYFSPTSRLVEVYVPNHTLHLL